MNIVKDFIVPGLFDAVMVSLLLCGVLLVEEVAYTFDISDNDVSTCVLEESTDPHSYVISILQSSLHHMLH